MKEDSSPTSKIRRYSMSQETEMLKVKTFIFGRDMVVLTRDGRLSMLTKPQKRRPQVCLNMDSTSEEYSTSDQECQ
jgi:hypothetical protein